MQEVSKFLVYALIDPIAFEVRYIGISSSGMKRPRCHLRQGNLKRDPNKHKTHWIRGLQRKGLQPYIAVVEEVGSREALLAAECKWIARYKPSGRLVNLTDGGDGPSGFRHSDAARERMSVAKREMYKERKSWLIGSTHTPEVRQRLREAHGTKIVDQNGTAYASINYAAQQLGIGRNGIGDVLAGRRESYKGYTFARA